MKLNSHKSLAKITNSYWKNYGGYSAFFKSPYLHFSILIGFTFYIMTAYLDQDWFQYPLDILPDIIGFSLGGYAIFLAFGDKDFFIKINTPSEKKTLTERIEDLEKISPYLKINTIFLHFIIMQLLALFLAITGKVVTTPLLGITSISLLRCPLMILEILFFSMFFYALSLAIATTLELYRLAGWYNKYINETIKENLVKETNNLD